MFGGIFLALTISVDHLRLTHNKGASFVFAKKKSRGFLLVILTGAFSLLFSSKGAELRSLEAEVEGGDGIKGCGSEVVEAQPKPPEPLRNSSCIFARLSASVN